MNAALNWVKPVVLSAQGFRLQPLLPEHATGLADAARDGRLWQLVVTSVPEPGQEQTYIELATQMPNRQAFAVIEEATGLVLGSTSYHDILPDVKRLDIGYTWYRQSRWRTAVNSACKWMLLHHAFDTLGAQTVGWQTDCLNTRSQAAIERLGAHKDGVIRGNILRRDGSVRDTVMYSLTEAEWPKTQQFLADCLKRPR